MRNMNRVSIALVICLAMSAAWAGPPMPMKSPLSGLVTMGRLKFLGDDSLPDNSLKEANTHPGVYSGAVILATWAQLQPAQDGPLDTRAIDQGLAAMSSYNHRYPATPLFAKLRIFAGKSAPDWAKSLDGGPITIYDKKIGQIMVGRFWSPVYRAAWRRLQDRLAAKYDTNPLVHEVAVSSCTATTAEPFIIPFNRQTIPSLQAAGYSDAADIACLNGAIDDYAAWRHVALDFTFNNFLSSDSGRPIPTPDVTIRIMERWRAAMGSRGVIANHGLKYPENEKKEQLMAEITRLGPPVEFQTKGAQVDWDNTFDLAQSFRATEFEIWETRDAGGPAHITYEQLKGWASRMNGRAR